MDDTMNKTAIAIDVGGTKTLGVLFGADGRVLSVRRDRGITPVDAPAAVCVALYSKMADTLLRDAASRGLRTVDTGYCSIATAEHYTPLFYDGIAAAAGDRLARLRVEPDGLCVISGMLGHSDGAAMICGTGSSLYVREGETFWRTGGWGHYIDSCGSGFVLGRLALRAVLRAHDGRGAPTLMTELAHDRAGKPVWAAYDEIYAGGRPYIAAFADCVFEARKAGDAAAAGIFDSCACDLAELLHTARRRLGKPYTAILNGGVFAHHPEYAGAVIALGPSDVTAMTGTTPPVYGCAVEAMHDMGLECGEDFKERFMTSLSGVSGK